MSNENEIGWARPPLETFEEQTEYDRASKTFRAKCAVCGKVKTEKKPWFRTRGAAKQKLRFKFGCCEKCGKWVCEDCFCIDDGRGNGIGICTACCKERGIKGLTIEQFDIVWPAIQSRFLARRKAAMRAIEKENEQGEGKREK